MAIYYVTWKIVPKQIDSMSLCFHTVIDHRGHKNVVRESVTHSVVPPVPLFCSYHIMTSSVIYYWTQTHGNVESIC